jgi:hypothetical protein
MACLLGVIIAQEYTIIHVDHEDDVTTKEDTIINHRRGVAQ